MRDLIKKLLREGLVNENTELINSILDKINGTGYDSLTDYEKSVLDKESKGGYDFETIDQDINSFLNDNLNGLTLQAYERKSLEGGKMIGYYFLDDNRNLKMDLQIYHIPKNSTKENIRYVLYIDERLDNKLSEVYNLSDSEQKKIVVDWFQGSEYIEKMKYNDELELPDNFRIRTIEIAWF